VDEYRNGRRSPETPEGFIEACDAAVAADIPKKQRRIELTQQNGWDSRAKELLGLAYAALPAALLAQTCPRPESAVSGATVSALLDAILALFDFIRHIDKHLVQMTQTMGPSLYFALFLIVFAETGLVVTPFLPGDSLLFAIGVLCAMDPVRLGLPADGFVPSLPVTMLILFVAAVLGDGVNYHVGKFVGPKVFSSEKSRFLNKKHLVKTQLFYEKYGPKTIIIARFVPIVRTFAPFVAGIGQMQYRRFVLFNIVGAALWVGLLVPLGYLFADTEVVKKRFELVIMAIIFLSILPMIIEIVREKMKPSPTPGE
jgi:membrane-associated protein